MVHGPGPPKNAISYHSGVVMLTYIFKNFNYSSLILCMIAMLNQQVNSTQYMLKQWIVLNARTDWLVKLRISSAIYLQTTREKMASRFTFVTSEEIIQIIFWGCILSHCFSIYTKTTIHLSVGGQRWIFTSPLRGSVNREFTNRKNLDDDAARS